jgi:alcohol dehydrogenase class IV
MRFDFTTPPRIVFGAGSLREAAPAARALGTHAFVLTGRNPYRSSPLLASLASRKIAATTFPIAGEPTTDHIATATARARASGCDFVIGFGGGSVIDSAKAVCALLTNPGEPLDYLEVVGRGAALTQPAAPCLAIPTTAGTGAEVTRNAVLLSPKHRVKASLRSPHMLPRVAIIDPDLTHGLPPAITATTGLDALTQLIEPYTSCRANPYTDALALDGLRRAAPALRRAFHHGDDTAARADLSLAALYSGLCLANAGLGAAHGFAGPIGGMFSAPHGAICAALLPHVIDVNLRACREPGRTAAAPSAADTERRYADVARALIGRDDATADDAGPFCRDLVAELQIPPLRTYGLTAAHVPALVEQSAKASSMKANPLPLTVDELSETLTRAL